MAESKELCQQWLRAKCRRGAACKFAHADIAIAPRRPEQCSYVAGWKRCTNAHSGVEDDGSLVCSEHTAVARQVHAAALEAWVRDEPANTTQRFEKVHEW